MVKEKVVECRGCKANIDKNKDKYVLLGTYDQGKALDESYYHFNCFSKWFNDKVNAKARSSVEDMQKKAMGLFQNMKGLVGNFQGMDQLGSMLGLDLHKQDVLQKTFGDLEWTCDDCGTKNKGEKCKKCDVKEEKKDVKKRGTKRKSK